MKRNIRQRLVQILDEITLYIFTHPRIIGRATLEYQPLPWIGVHDARRSIGSKDRLEVIKSTLRRK